MHARRKIALCLAAILGAGAAPANAQVAAGANEELGEVIVTARRVEERAQDVPISMSVFDQQQLTDRNIVSAADLAIYTPSLAADNTFGQDASAFSIRGFAQAIQTTPSVAVYFADAVIPRGGNVGEPAGSGAGPGSFFDLQNIQVLKGPQGTLFGRNTTGGAVLLVPTKPTAQFEGYAEGTYGNNDLGRVQAVLNVPLSDKVRLRLGVDNESRSGYVDNTTGIGPTEFNDIDYSAARLSLVVDITPDLENYLIGTYALSQNHGPLPQLFVCNPSPGPKGQGVGLGFLCPTQFFPLADAAAAFGAKPPYPQPQGAYTAQNDLPAPQSYFRQYQAINTTTWHANDDLTVKNIFSYGQLRTSLDSDLFGTNLNFPFGPTGPTPFYVNASNPSALGAGATITDQYTLSDELQLAGNAFGNKLTWQAGGYVEYSAPSGGVTGSRSATQINCTNVATLQCFDVLGSEVNSPTGLVTNDVQDITYKDMAAFAQDSYALTDQLKLTTGVRYTIDISQATSYLSTYEFPGPTFMVPQVFCASSFTSLTNNCRQYTSDRSDAPTWLIDLEYKPIQNTMLYAKYARGYRQGSIVTTAPAGINTFNPEHLDSYEIGEKTSFYGPVSGTFNVTAFYNDFTDQQLLTALAKFDSLGVIQTAQPDVINAGKSRIYGFEVESTLVPWKPLTLGLGYAYLDTLVQSVTFPTDAQIAAASGGAFNGIIQTVKPGDSLPFAPRNKLSANVVYRLPVPQSVGAVSFGATYSYQSHEFISSFTPYGTLPPYGLLNLNLNWHSFAEQPVDVELFATNVTDKLYYSNVNQFYNLYGFEVRYLGEPRMYGGRIRIHF